MLMTAVTRHRLTVAAIRAVSTPAGGPRLWDLAGGRSNAPGHFDEALPADVLDGEGGTRAWTL